MRYIVEHGRHHDPLGPDPPPHPDRPHPVDDPRPRRRAPARATASAGWATTSAAAKSATRSACCSSRRTACRRRSSTSGREDAIYAVSPQDPARFITDSQKAYEAVAGRHARRSAGRAGLRGRAPDLVGPHRRSTWRWRRSLLNVALWAYIFANYPDLSNEITIEFPPIGDITTLHSRDAIFKIPGTASGDPRREPGGLAALPTQGARGDVSSAEWHDLFPGGVLGGGGGRRRQRLAPAAGSAGPSCAGSSLFFC